MPITEATTFGHQKVVDYLRLWDETHTEHSEQAEEIPIRKHASEESVPLP
jgi:hypothetical protein